MHRRSFLAVGALAPAIAARADAEDEERAVRDVIARYVQARMRRDASELEALLAADADQLVSDGTWRSGRAVLVAGMLESSNRNPAKRTITVEKVRFPDDSIALVDGRYVQEAETGDKARQMWTAILLQKTGGVWRIAAIRNMLPARG